jgi:hypothetical protein
VAQVVAYVPDLLFGSQLLSMLRAAGHQATLVSSLDGLKADDVDVLIVDLTADPSERIAAANAMAGARKLAFYAHVEADVRAAAEAAGFDLVVPRSRMAREGAELVARLL